ncbi:hypothetical protein [uncultured Deinococcus sp.]|uniref:hypothetical protein n=1 Tax=uncultured Deinococcus sp. TaxID=158789 RepID=UPI0025D1159A|nr:hypothetical protein [uncultured Deinococcus sp.]
MPTDNRDPLPVNPTLMPHTEPVRDDQPAEQGHLPDVLPDAPGVPVPTTDGLSAQEVTDLVGGGDASMVEANRALEQAEGLDPDTES